jgi:hypothetical protein
MIKLVKLFFVFLFAILFTQCRTSRSGKAITKAIAAKDTTQLVKIKNTADSLAQIKETKDLMQKTAIDFTTFKAKIKLDIETSKGKKPDLIANVRMIKDSAVWISISIPLINYEVFRAIIKKDSVILMDIREKEVFYRSISYLQEMTDIPFDLRELQNLFVGNPIFFNKNNMTVKKFEKYLLVVSASSDLKSLATYSLPENLLQHCKLDDVDIMQNRTADVTYDDYSNENGIAFATRRQIIASEKNKLDIRMNFKQYEFNKELSVSFNVPKNYKKK